MGQKTVNAPADAPKIVLPTRMTYMLSIRHIADDSMTAKSVAIIMRHLPYLTKLPAKRHAPAAPMFVKVVSRVCQRVNSSSVQSSRTLNKIWSVFHEAKQ